MYDGFGRCRSYPGSSLRDSGDATPRSLPACADTADRKEQAAECEEAPRGFIHGLPGPGAEEIRIVEEATREE